MTKSIRVSSSTLVALFIAASGVSGYVVPKTPFSSLLPVNSRPILNVKSISPLRMSNGDETFNEGGQDASHQEDGKASATISKNSNASSSKREMLKFAVPALGIFLANPLLSNIDNAFVGKTVGTKGLAALSPATICTDQMIYLFSFLSRATTGLVSRARGLETDPDEKDAAAARASSAPLTVALMTGVLLSIFYAFCTPNMLSVLNVTPALRGPAASYIYWRGAIAWAALAQSVSLSILLASRDSITPLKIVALAAGVNVIGDYLLCVFPLRWGVPGAAAATTFATLFSSTFLIRALKKKKIFPKIKLPSRKEIGSLMEFTGPLLAITLTRLYGFVSMQRTAMKLGVNSMAAYQVLNNLLVFHILFAEPLSQLSQTQLPELIDAGDGPQVKSNLKSVLSLGSVASLVIGAVAGLAALFGSSLFSSDPTVQLLAKGASPALFMAVATSIFTITVDGAMLASKDFPFMLGFGTFTMLVQMYLLKNWCTSISDIFATFIFRLGSYAIVSLIRAGLGKGKLGRALLSGGGTTFFRRKTINGAVNGTSGEQPASMVQ